jgi:hypothetical protein
MTSGGELFIVDNSEAEWKGLCYLEEWTEIASSFDIAAGYFEMGALLALHGKWQKLDKIRILMGDEISVRTRQAILESLPVGFQSGFKSRIAATMAEIDADIAYLRGGGDPNKPFQIPVTGAIKILRQIYSTLDFRIGSLPSLIPLTAGLNTCFSQWSCLMDT